MARKKNRRSNPTQEASDYTPLAAALVAASIGISAYHGVKRNNGSVGWGLWWGLMGGLFPVVTPAIAFGQGLSTPIQPTPIQVVIASPVPPPA